MNVDYIKYGDVYLPALEAPKEHYDLCRFGHAYLRHLKQNKRSLYSQMMITIFEIPITMMLFYGLRREEAIGLKWQNIDFDNDTFLIAHTVTETKVDGHLQLVKEDLTKNSSSYHSLPLVAPVKELLLEKEQSI